MCRQAQGPPAAGMGDWASIRNRRRARPGREAKPIHGLDRWDCRTLPPDWERCAVIEILSPSPWQMTFGERAALEGILSQLRPRLAIEIGTAEGGSLARIAKHTEHVHSFDLLRPNTPTVELEHVTLHTGDSHVLLPRLLGRLAADGQNVDFVLVDGDHSADGVERDVRDLLGSDAIQHTVIVIHDTLNDEVRKGLARINYSAQPKVVHADLDFIGGHLSLGGAFQHELWGGLGLLVVDDGGTQLPRPGGENGQFYDLFKIVAPARDALVARERHGGSADPDELRQAVATNRFGDGNNQLAQAQAEISHLRDELDRTRGWLDAIQSSLSWRITAPLRAAKRAVHARVSKRP
jgi:Methyltransferase domain